MFNLRINPADLARDTWNWSAGRWSCGSSWIVPYRHPLTDQVAFTDGERTALVSATRTTGTSRRSPEVGVIGEGFDKVVAALVEDRDDWVVVQTCRDGSVMITTGTACTVPQYLAAVGGVLHGSWDLVGLRDQQSPDRLDPLAVTRHLALRTRYSHTTFWEDVRLLTERATAHFTPDGKTVFRFPEPAPHTRARELSEGADPVPVFLDLLDMAVAKLPWEGSSTGVQLSGGMDSTVVALALRTAVQGAGVTAGAVTLDGEVGSQQRRRRRMILDYIGSGWSDVTVDALDHLPYGAASCYSRGHLESPHGDIYVDALDALSGHFVDNGVDTVFTGIGGDELMAVTSAEEPGGWGWTGVAVPPWLGPVARDLLPDVDTGITPASVVPETALMAKSVAASSLLRRGIWPMHPLTDPTLVRLCEWLPKEWRGRKRLMREIISRTGMSSLVARPPLPENFEGVIVPAMRRYGAPRIRRILADGSPLIDAGLLDPGGLSGVAARLESGGLLLPSDHEVAFVLLADSALTRR
ncbi:asparagine synthase-related protein [Kitasatospora sp. NPDC048365]|uniref:asparagine synthase-related protein n=1 Tax=Kitasatospora sp. NPDC048365 TaxID=3364050 RepID=UPI00371D9034